MQLATGIPIDLVVVIQALVIVFVAAPRLIREIYRIRVPETTGTEVLAQGWKS
jgi:simple sugar transport system permease protein